MGLLQPGQAVLPAARGPEPVLGGRGGRQPLLVLRRGQVGSGGQQLGRVVGAGRVRVVGSVRCVGPVAREKAAVVLLRELRGGFGSI